MRSSEEPAELARSGVESTMSSDDDLVVAMLLRVEIERSRFGEWVQNMVAKKRREEIAYLSARVELENKLNTGMMTTNHHPVLFVRFAAWNRPCPPTPFLIAFSLSQNLE